MRTHVRIQWLTERGLSVYTIDAAEVAERSFSAFAYVNNCPEESIIIALLWFFTLCVFFACVFFVYACSTNVLVNKDWCERNRQQHIINNRRYCYECHQRSQFTGDNIELFILRGTNSLYLRRWSTQPLFKLHITAAEHRRRAQRLAILDTSHRKPPHHTQPGPFSLH